MRFLIVLLFSVTTVTAQNIEKTIQIEKIDVKGKRTISESALTKTTIDSLQFAESSNLSFAELLTKHTPLFIKSYGLGSMATVSFRGTAASHTQVEWNGLNINNPMLGQVDFSMIPVWFIDKAELLHGGSSLQQGAGALGGSVITGSVPVWSKQFYGSVMQGAGSFSNYQSSVSVGGGDKNIQLRLRYMYQQAENDFEFLNSAVPPFEYVRQKNADYHKHTAVADMFWNAGNNHVLSFNTWYHTANRNLPTIMSYEGKGRNERQDDNELRLVGKWAWYGKHLKSELISGYSNTSLDYYLANITDMGTIVNYDAQSKVQSLQNNYKLEWNISERSTMRTIANLNHHSVSTLDYRTQEGYSANRTDFGVSLSWHQRFGETLCGYLLARYENSGSFMPSAGIEFDVLKSLNFKLNATRNYHQPTLNDLHWLPGGNPDLLPERGYTTDLSIEYTKDRYHFGVTGYMSLIDNWIIWRPGEFRYWSAINIKKVFSRGVEFNFESQHHISKVKLTIKANYAYTKTTNQEPDLEGDESKGKQLIYIPLNKANVMLDATYRGFYIYYMWSFTDERFTNSSNQITRHTLAAYNLHNLTLGKTICGFDLQLKIDNLFNKDYQAILWRAMPRRNYTVLLKYSF